MKWSALALALLLVLFLLKPLQISLAMPHNGVLEIPLSGNVPNIDGRWDTPTEWTDGLEIELQDSQGWTVFIRIKQCIYGPKAYLFILVDCIHNLASSGAYRDVYVGLDYEDQGGNAPQTDDFYFMAYGNHLAQGDGTHWSPVWPHPDGFECSYQWSSINDPYESSEDHLTVEYKFPANYVFTSSAHGFYIAVAYPNTEWLILEWPEGAGGYWDPDKGLVLPAPGMWGDVFLKPVCFTIETDVSTFAVIVESNSTLSDFQFNGTAICFNVIGENGTIGFCRICIPTALMNATYKVFVNATEVSCNLLPCSNSTHSYLYFNYTHSTQEVIIIPEFPSFLIMPLFMIATLLAVIIYRKKTLKVTSLFLLNR
jgi:hypothetical protein